MLKTQCLQISHFRINDQAFWHFKTIDWWICTCFLYSADWPNQRNSLNTFYIDVDNEIRQTMLFTIRNFQNGRIHRGLIGYSQVGHLVQNFTFVGFQLTLQKGHCWSNKKNIYQPDHSFDSLLNLYKSAKLKNIR